MGSNKDSLMSNQDHVCDDKTSPESGTSRNPSSGPGHAQPAPLAPPPVTRKLDLACGQMPMEGFEGVDIFVAAQHVVNLQQYPWPFADESVLELHCSHYIEHIPMENVAHQGLGTGLALHKDALFAFFDECYRILVPGGWITLRWPANRSDRAFQDPTHRRFIPAETMAYLNQEWRRANRLDHYNVDCHFLGSCDPVIDQSLLLRADTVIQQKIRHDWNIVIDFTAKLQKMPRL